MPPTPQKSVTFCTHYKHDKRKRTDKRKHIDRHIDEYHSDPGQPEKKPPATKKKEPLRDDDARYYSEPDAKYFEIDYEFLKELRQIARNNCPKCRRRSKKVENVRRCREKRQKEKRSGDYVLCNGRYHNAQLHCRFCCKICNRSTDFDSMEEEYSLVSKSYSFPSSRTSDSRSRSTPSKLKERESSIPSNKSVSFLDAPSEAKHEPNYTAKSFTNDLKKFLLKPTSPRLSLREKFMISFKQELEATKKSPKLKAMKGIWKSY